MATRRPGPDPAGAPGHGPAGHGAEDPAEDLDAPVAPVAPVAPDGPGPAEGQGRRWTRWPTGVPAWARSPAAVLTLVVLAALAGGVVGSAGREARDAEAVLSRAVSVGYAYVAGQDGDAAAQRSRAQLRVVLLNQGDRPVQVRVQGLSLPAQGTVEPPEPVEVAPGAVVAAPLLVDVDCSALRAGASATPADGTGARVLADVRSADGGRRAVDVSLPVLEDVAAEVAEQLRTGCGAGSGTAPATGWLWQEDGTLRVSVANPRGTGEPVRLLLDASPGLGATTEPVLPLDLLPGGTAVVDVRVEPDCAVVGDGSGSWLDLRSRDRSGATTPLSAESITSATTTVQLGSGRWLARQVALACG